MTYSLLKPKKKPIFSLFSKIWIGFIALVLCALIGANLYIQHENLGLLDDLEEINSQYALIVSNIHKTNEKIATLTTQKNLANAIYASNLLLKQSIKNLFDLVPDSVTLSEVYSDNSTLIIKGITPTRDVFNLLLGAPLRSIFSTSNTTFHQAPNGWLNFISTNKTENLEKK